MQSFIDYLDDVDAALMAGYAIDTWDAGIDADQIAEAQDAGETTKKFAQWFAEKHDLTPFGGRIDNSTKARIEAARKAAQ